MFIGFTSFRSSAAAALKLGITYCHFSCNTPSTNFEYKVEWRNTHTDTHNTMLRSINRIFSGARVFLSFICSLFIYQIKAEWKLFSFHFSCCCCCCSLCFTKWKWTAIRYHSFSHFVLLFMFSFSVRTNVSRCLFIAAQGKIVAEICYGPRQQYPSSDRSPAFGNWMVKALCQRILHFTRVFFSAFCSPRMIFYWCENARIFLIMSAAPCHIMQ